MVATGASPELEEGETFSHIPAGKLLFQLLEGSRAQIALNWTPTGNITCSWLARIHGYCSAVARATLRQRPDDGPATRLTEAWTQLDHRYGASPADRGWQLPSREADERLNLLEAYLVEAGPTSLFAAEPDAPVHYLTREELGL